MTTAAENTQAAITLHSHDFTHCLTCSIYLEIFSFFYQGYQTTEKLMLAGDTVLREAVESVYPDGRTECGNAGVLSARPRLDVPRQGADRGPTERPRR